MSSRNALHTAINEGRAWTCAQMAEQTGIEPGEMWETTMDMVRAGAIRPVRSHTYMPDGPYFEPVPGGELD